MRLTLSRKIIITIGAGVLVASVLLSIITFVFLKQTAKEEVNTRLNSISYLKEESIDQYLQMHILEIENILKKNEIKKDLMLLLDGKEENGNAVVAKTIKENSIYKDNLLDISIINKDGTVVASTNEVEIGKIKSEEPYFFKARENTIVQNFNYDILTKQIITIISTPIIDEGNVVGVISEKINTNDINKIMINRDGLGKTGETFLVNSFNFVTTDLLKEPNSVLTRTIYLPQINDCLKKNSNYYVQNDYHGDRVFGYSRWIPEIDSCLISKIDKREIMTPIAQALPQIISFLIIILIITLVFGHFIGQSIIRPLQKLRNKAIKIKEGDLDVQIEPESNDEIGDLATVLKGMLFKLKNVYKGLEDKVKERTKELEESENKLKESLSKAEELSSIVRDANEPIFSQSLDGVVLSWNSGAEDFFGYTADEMIGNSIEVTIPENRYDEIENIKKIITSGKKIDHYQTMRKKKDGTLVDVAISVSPIKDLEGSVTGVSVVLLDITKEKEVDKAKTEFVSIASHQFRTPLSSMSWYIEMLLAGDAGKINEEQKKYLEEISIGNKRMVNLVDDLLSVSRLDMGEFVLDISQFNLINMLESVLKELSPQILRKKLVIEKMCDENLPQFLADEKLMRMIFQNLLSNAVKYTPAGGTIKVNLLKVGKGKKFGGKTMEEESLAFSVSDPGVGIPTYQQGKVFSKLFRADNIKESEPEGTGLGLYVVKSVADQSGGFVWFKSEENKGSIFYVSFPITGMKVTRKEN